MSLAQSTRGRAEGARAVSGRAESDRGGVDLQLGLVGRRTTSTRLQGALGARGSGTPVFGSQARRRRQRCVSLGASDAPGDLAGGVHLPDRTARFARFDAATNAAGPAG